jgi:corrinoid protein of di/trimethylamine methyltransferase
MTILEQLKEAVLEGEQDSVVTLANQVLESGHDPLDAINNGMIPGMDEASTKFDEKEYYVPDLLVAARALKAGLDILLPKVSMKREITGRVGMGTVAGDIHEIGKNIVIALLETAGFEVIDLGVDVPTEKFVEAVREQNLDVLGISALLTFTMPEIPKVVEALQEAGLREKVKVVIGGAPLSDSFAERAGVDGYAKDGVKAVQMVKKLVQK